MQGQVSDDQASDRQTQAIAIKAKKIADSPWFDITLFRTHIKFRLPNSTQSPPRDALGRQVDQRPFVNTAARENYEINEELGRCLTNLYNAAWKVKTTSFFARNAGEIQFKLFGVGVAKSDRLVYDNLYDGNIATTFLRNYYSSNFADIALESIDLVEREFNAVNTYYVTVPGHKIDCFVPFSALDLLLLSFEFIPGKKADEIEPAALSQVLTQFADSIIATLEMRLAHKS